MVGRLGLGTNSGGLRARAELTAMKSAAAVQLIGAQSGEGQRTADVATVHIGACVSVRLGM